MEIPLSAAEMGDDVKIFSLSDNRPLPYHITYKYIMQDKYLLLFTCYMLRTRI